VPIVDENGRNVNEEYLKENEEYLKESATIRTHDRLYQFGMGAVIWGLAAAIGLGGLYWMSLLSGD
jgi:hypothetical protein